MVGVYHGGIKNSLSTDFIRHLAIGPRPRSVSDGIAKHFTRCVILVAQQFANVRVVLEELGIVLCRCLVDQ